MKPKLQMREIITAVQSPDVYAGDGCDGIRPQWNTYAMDDMDSDCVDVLNAFEAKDFPAGTVIEVKVPECPCCGLIQEMQDENCNFDWAEWLLNEYS